MGWINGRGFLILSETASLKGNKISVDYKIEIYEFRVTDFSNPQLQISKISSQLPGPEPRTHPSVAFHDKYIFLIGGEKLAENRHSLFDDVWCFNL